MNQNINDQIEYPQSGILSKVIEKNDAMDVTLFCMAEGVEMSEHTSTKQGFVHVLEGDGVFTLEGEEIAMTPGVFIYMKAHAVHALRAQKNTSFLLVLANGN